MTDGTGHVDSEKKNESIAQLSSNGSALHVQKESYLRPFCCFEKKNDQKKKKKTLPSDWFWDLCCHI